MLNGLGIIRLMISAIRNGLILFIFLRISCPVKNNACRIMAHHSHHRSSSALMITDGFWLFLENENCN